MKQQSLTIATKMSQQLLIDYWQRVTTIMTVKIRQFSPITDAFENVIILSDPTRGWTQPVTNSVSHSNCWFIQIGASQVMVFDIGRTGLKKIGILSKMYI